MKIHDTHNRSFDVLPPRKKTGVGEGKGWNLLFVIASHHHPHGGDGSPPPELNNSTPSYSVQLRASDWGMAVLLSHQRLKLAAGARSVYRNRPIWTQPVSVGGGDVMAILEGAIERREQTMARQRRDGRRRRRGGAHNILCDLGNRWGGVLELAGSRGLLEFFVVASCCFCSSKYFGCRKALRNVQVYVCVLVGWFPRMRDVCRQTLPCQPISGTIRYLCPEEFRPQDAACLIHCSH